MNEKLNLVEILKDCPKGTKLYSTIFGEVKLHEVRYGIDIYTICIENKAGGQYWLTSDGRYANRFDGECTLFPSREQRDWSKFKPKKLKFKAGDKVKNTFGFIVTIVRIDGNYYDYVNEDGQCGVILVRSQDDWELAPNKFDPKTLKPFDKVLGFFNGIWNCDLYSNYLDNRLFPYICFRSCVSRIIPYNDDTKHLAGTSNEAPEFYHYWED